MKKISLFLILTFLLIFPAIVSASDTYFFAFNKAKVDDPPAQIQTGIDMTDMITQSIQNLSENIQINVLKDSENYRFTVEDFKNQMENYKNLVGSDDTFVLYVHSHGVMPGVLIDDEYYLWKDFSADILSLKAANIIILVQTCHSGRIMEALENHFQRGVARPDNCNFLILASVSAEQVGYAVNINDERVNPFSYAINQELEKIASGNKTTYRQFSDKIINQTIELSRKSDGTVYEPQIYSGFNDEDLVLSFDSVSNEQDSIAAIDELIKDVKYLLSPLERKFLVKKWSYRARKLDSESENYTQKLSNVGLTLVWEMNLYRKTYMKTVRRWYRYFLRRKPDVAGLIYWCDRLEKTGGKIHQVRNEFKNAANTEKAKDNFQPVNSIDGGM
jgi:hypothetical protein